MSSAAGGVLANFGPKGSSRWAVQVLSKCLPQLSLVALSSPPMRLSRDVTLKSFQRDMSSWLRTFTPRDVWGLRHKSKDGGIGETSTMHQGEGGEIQEVPLAVFKTKSSEDEDQILEEVPKKMSGHKAYLKLDAREEAAFVEGFRNFTSPQQIIKILDTIPTQEVTPAVALGILKKLFELESNFNFRNEGLPWTVSSEHGALDTFARTAIVTRLVDTIVTSDDTSIIIHTLNAFKSEKPLENGSDYRSKMYNEVLLRVTKGQFSLSQVCDAVIILGKIEQNTGQPIPDNLIDKLWIGIFEKTDDIDAQNITLLFQVLPHFRKSRRLVLNLAERKLLALWWKVNPSVVAQICEIITNEKSLSRGSMNNVGSGTVGVTNRTLSALSRCTHLNLHQISEADLLHIVQGFQAQNFCDATFEKTLNKYMRAKGLKVSDPKVIAAVMEYAKKFQIRSECILEAAAEFFVMTKAENISPPQLTAIVTAFGHLDFQPPNGVRFWQLVESYLNEKFIQFSPKDIIEVLLSCVQLTKYPLNFVDRMFSPYFLDRVHTCEKDLNQLQALRSKLKLLDSSLTIECPNKYAGPMLPKDFTARNVFIDGRIMRMANWLEDIIREVLGVSVVTEKHTVLPGLPLNVLYIADILVMNKSRHETDRYTFVKNRIASRLNTGVEPYENSRNATIVLIHVPEHYSRDGQNLIGSQVMRIRQLKYLGFNVVPLSYSEINELKMHPSELRRYVKERIRDSGYVFL